MHHTTVVPESPVVVTNKSSVRAQKKKFVQQSYRPELFQSATPDPIPAQSNIQVILRFLYATRRRYIPALGVTAAVRPSVRYRDLTTLMMSDLHEIARVDAY